MQRAKFMEGSLGVSSQFLGFGGCRIWGLGPSFGVRGLLGFRTGMGFRASLGAFRGLGFMV